MFRQNAAMDARNAVRTGWPRAHPARTCIDPTCGRKRPYMRDIVSCQETHTIRPSSDIRPALLRSSFRCAIDLPRSGESSGFSDVSRSPENTWRRGLSQTISSERTWIVSVDVFSTSEKNLFKRLRLIKLLIFLYGIGIHSTLGICRITGSPLGLQVFCHYYFINYSGYAG